jgi:hypothetical protein
MTEEEYLSLVEYGKFDEIASRIYQTPDSELSQEEKQELLYDLEVVKQEYGYDQAAEEAFRANKYSNLTTTRTKYTQSGNEIVITDNNDNQIGVAIDGNEKLLLDLYATKVYDSLKKPDLDEKMQLLKLSRDYKFLFDGVRYTGKVNGRTIEFYAIGNNREIKAYAVTVTSPDAQDIRIIMNTANDLILYFEGLKETFPTVA